MTRRRLRPQSTDERATALVGVVQAIETEIAQGYVRSGAHRILAIGPTWVAVDIALGLLTPEDSRVQSAPAAILLDAC